MRKRKAKKLTVEQLTKIKLHTMYLVIAGWYPPGHPEIKRIRRVLVEGKFD